MFATSGYFRGVNCPYFVSGLCERPYCHFRHVKPVEEPKALATTWSGCTPEDNIGSNAATKDGNVGLAPRPPQRQNSLLSMVGSAIQQVQRDIEKDKATLASLKHCEMRHGQRKPTKRMPSYHGIVAKKSRVLYKPTPVLVNPPNPAAAASSGNYGRRATVLEYNPTPINVLKQQKKTPKYTIQQEEVSDLEYDPASNYSTGNSLQKRRVTLPNTSNKSGIKRRSDTDLETVSKKARLEEVEAKFSDEDEDLEQEQMGPCKIKMQPPEPCEDISTAEDTKSEKAIMNNSGNNIDQKEEKLTAGTHVSSVTDTKASSNTSDINSEVGDAEPEKSVVSMKCDNIESDAVIKVESIEKAVVDLENGSTGNEITVLNDSSEDYPKTKDSDEVGVKNIFDIMVNDSSDKDKTDKISSSSNAADKEKSHSDKENHTLESQRKNRTNDHDGVRHSDKRSKDKHKHSSSSSSKEKRDHGKEKCHTSKDSHSNGSSHSSHSTGTSSHGSLNKHDKDKHKHSHHHSSSRRDSTSSSTCISDKQKSSKEKRRSSSSEKHKSSSSSSCNNKHKSSSSSKEKSHSEHGHHKSKHVHGQKSSSEHKSRTIKDSGKSRHRSGERRSSGDTQQNRERTKSNSGQDRLKNSNAQSLCSKSELNKKSKGSASVGRKVSNVDLFGEDSDGEEKLPHNHDNLCSGDDDMGSDGAIEISSEEDVGMEDLMALEMEVGDALDNHDTYEECLKIFKDESLSKKFQIMDKKAKIIQKKEECEEEDADVGKKRVAHAASEQAAMKRRIPDRPFSRPSPAQVMHNRFVELQKRAKEVAIVSPKKPGPVNTGDVNGGGRRMARVPSRAGSSVGGIGVGSLVKKKPKIFSTPTGSIEESTFLTSYKDSKRTAHIPTKAVLLKRPTVPTEFGSRVPTNVRQRYLNLLIDECLKIYPEEKDAYDRGLTEEKAVYERSSSRTVYLNVAVNAIKKLRSESGLSSPPNNKTSPNKNPKTVTHEFVLGGRKAVNTTFTIKRCSKLPKKKQEDMKGAALYKHLSNYILTEEQLVDNGFPRFHPDYPGTVVMKEREGAKKNIKSSDPNEKVCCRCGNRFSVLPNGKYVRQEECVYHWGKAFKRRVAGVVDSRYTCCQGDLNTKGCQVGKCHVYESNKKDNLGGYMKTFPCSPPVDGNFGLFALDCEMIYTTGGCELARVTVVGEDLKPVYESLVKPDNEVLDCNTRFSGLTDQDMEDASTSLRDVQAVLLSMFNDKTILMGHSLESDLIALKLVHNTVVDTSVVFPHRLGPPYKRGLRMLMADILQKIIQNDVGGHDSQEDALACLELMLWKVKDDVKRGKHLS